MKTIESSVVILTPSEWEIIIDRLDLSDCLADCLSDSAEGEPLKPWTYDQVMACANALSLRLRVSRLFDVTTLTELETEILRDCIEGSTYAGRMGDAFDDGEISKGRWASICKALASVDNKFRSAGITHTGFPRF